jgi:ABC-2 type transport system ATP-binding protein
VSIALGSEAINAINLKVDKPASPNPEAPIQVVGAPTVTLHYSGLGASRNVYAQLVDDKTGRVLGNILTPIPVKLDGTSREITVSM